MKLDAYSFEPYKEHGDKCHAQQMAVTLFTWLHISIMMTGKLLLCVIFADSVSITYPQFPDEP